MNYELIQTIVGFLGLITIFLLWWQIKSDLKWKKINMSLNKVDLSLLDKNGDIINNFGIDMDNENLTNEEYQKLINEKKSDVLNKIFEILDMFENFSILFNLNALNVYFAYEAYSENTIFFFKKFFNIIEYRRIAEKDHLLYKNFEKCAKAFLKIKESEQKKFEELKQDTNVIKNKL